MLQKLNKRIEEQKMIPEIVKVKLAWRKAIAVDVTLPTEQELVIKQIAEEFKIQEKLPKGWHITFAYQYKPFPDSTCEKKVKREFMKKMKKIITESQSIFPLHFEEPKLCYFNDMKQFIPWKGDFYPF